MCPTYGYACNMCDMPTDITEKISEHNPHLKRVCDHCPDGVLERMISASFIEFKGDGWSPHTNWRPRTTEEKSS